MANNRISVLIDVTVDKANRALTSFRTSIKEADGAVGKFKAGAASLSASLRANAVPVAAAAGAAFVKFAGDAVSASSDLAESQNAVEKSFGSSAEAVLEIGENAATSMGLSERAFNEAAVGFAAFTETIAGPGGDTAGVLEDLSQRAADFASVMNLEVSDAADTFRSALSGEQEAIKRYGIDMSAAAVEAYAMANGLIETKDQLTENIKVQARYGLLMESTSKFAGDFADTSDGLANSQRTLKATVEDLQAKFGDELLPTLEMGVGILNFVAEAADKVDLSMSDLGETINEDSSAWDIVKKSMTDILNPSKAIIETTSRYIDNAEALFDSNEDAAESIDGVGAALVQEEIDLALAAAARARYVAEQDAAVEASKEAAAEWEESTQAMADAAIENYEDMVSAAEAWAEGIAGQLDSGAQSFYDMQVTEETTGRAWIDGMNERSIAANNHELRLRSISQQIGDNLVGVTDVTDEESAEFIGYLASMGEGGQTLVADIENGTVPIEEAIGAWRVASEVGGDGMVAGLDPVAAGMAEKMDDADAALQQELLAAAWKASTNAMAIGTAITDGVGAGIGAGQGPLNAKVRAMVDSALQAAKEEAGIASPSKLFEEEVGAPIAEGVAEGIVEEGDKVAEAAVDAIEDAEDAAVDAAESMVDAVSDVLDGLWDAIGAERSLEDLEEDVADAVQAVEDAEQAVEDAQDERRAARKEQLAAAEALAAARASGDPDAIAEAEERMSDATERAIDAETGLTDAHDDLADAADKLENKSLKLAEATQENIGKSDELTDAWIRLAEQAGLTAEQINEIVDAQLALNAAMADADDTSASVGAEADSATRIVDDFAAAVRAGLISADDLERIGGLTGQRQLDAMAAKLNDLLRLFGEVPAYATGGIVPGPSSQGQLAVVHGGETIMPADEMRRAVSDGMVDGWRKVEQMRRAR